VNKGIGCVSCHGRVDKMRLTYQYPSLQMEWCLECHRNPEKNLRPKDRIFDLDWKADDQAALGAALKKEYGIRSAYALTNCSTCHR
jgi:cytochrome c553